MSKSNKTAQDFFKKKKAEKKEDVFQEAFEVRPANTSPLDAFLGSADLSNEEKEYLRSELLEQAKSGNISVDQAEKDSEELLGLSSQIRAITKQSIILHGERIFKAQKILAKYRKSMWQTWLKVSYGNRQTPYNFLYYYNLYKAVPKEDQSLIQQMPVRAAYLLSSRDGEMKKKLEIIRNHATNSQKDLISVIQKAFPTAESDGRGRREGSRGLAKTVLQNLKALTEVQQPLSPSCLATLEQAQGLLAGLLEKSSNKI